MNKPQTNQRRERRTHKLFFPLMPMRDRLHLAWPQIITVMKIITTKVPNPRSPAPPPNWPQTGTAQPTATDDALICCYHQRFGDKARSCRDPCAFALNCLNQRKVATLAPAEPNEKLSPSRLLYVADRAGALG